MDKSIIVIILDALISGLLLANLVFMIVLDKSIRKRQEALQKEIDRLLKS